MSAMSSALEGVRSELSPEQYDEMMAYFEMAAHQMRNV
jgi:truncated hemoglobin YjbI